MCTNSVANAIECGIELSQARNNTVFHNSFFSSDNKGICLSNAAQGNDLRSNLIDSPERYAISVKNQDTTDNIFANNIIRLANA